MRAILKRPDGFIAQEARKVLSRHGITTPEQIRVRRVAESMGIGVEVVPVQGFAGVLLRGPAGATILIAERLNPARRRFTLAHELGHTVLHPADTPRHACRWSDLQAYSYSAAPREREANVFATELVMPGSLFKAKLQHPPSLDQIRQLAGEFRVSLTAAAIRLCEQTDERCAVVLAKKGRIAWSYCSANFGLTVPQGGSLDVDTFAFDASRSVAVPEEPKPVPLAGWVEEEVSSRAVVFEQSVAMPRYASCLSLLWLDEIEEEDYGSEW